MPSWHGSRSATSNGTTLHRANRCRMALWRASTAGCATSASTSTCSPTSTRRARSSKHGGSTTTPTDRTRASTGSHRLSSQHAPRRGKTGTDSPYERGQVGEQVSWSRSNFDTIPNFDVTGSGGAGGLYAGVILPSSTPLLQLDTRFGFLAGGTSGITQKPEAS